MKKTFIVFAIIYCVVCTLSAYGETAVKIHQPTKIELQDGSIWDGIITGEMELGEVTVESLPSFEDATGSPTRALLDSSLRPLISIDEETIGLVDAINAVTAAVQGSLVVEAELVTDSIGLITAITAIETDVEANSTKLDTVNTNLGTMETDVESVDASVQAVEDAIKPSTEIETQVITLVANTSQSISSSLTGDRRYIEITTMDNTKDFWLDFDTAAVEDNCRRVYGGVYLELDKTIVPHVLASEAIDLMVIEGGY